MKFEVQKAFELYQTEKTITDAVKKHCIELDIPYEERYRHQLSRLVNKEKVDKDLDNVSYTDSVNYSNDIEKAQPGFSAVAPDGTLFNINQYCEYYGLDFSKIRSYKLITHTGRPFFNVVFHEEEVEPVVSEEELKTLILDGLAGIKRTTTPEAKGNGKIGVVKIADLHLGSYVDNLIRTKNFSIDILANKLLDAVDSINERGYSTVHVHILGDIIESFTGLSHVNTWKGLDKAMVGAEAVKLVVKVLHQNFLSKINNLGEVKVVAGNHDRVTSSNKEDVQGEAANLACWGLELIGYSVEFNPLVVTHTIGKITHILTHGHHALSKKSTKQLCWDYGIQGNYNLICEGHLHSIIQKLNVNQRDGYQTIKDDAVDHRRMNCPSFFTGNFFSESLGYTSESGFVITEDNGKGIPNVFYYAV